jgi:hypothetical protein
VLIAVVPFAARPFLGFSVDAFDTVSIGGFAGSLFGVLVLVAVPVTLLGAAAPWAVRLAVGEVASSGEVVGRLYAISTAGSLLGTMISALLLIPLLGTQRTFLVFSLALALVGAAGIGRRGLGVPLDQRGCRWTHPLRGGDDAPVRPGGRTARRDQGLGAERGPGGSLALPTRLLSHR